MPQAVEADPFEALSDPSRREILERLRAGGRSVRDLADGLPISRPAVSRHLRVLKEAGLVRDRPSGTRRIYELDPAGAATVRKYLSRLWGEAAARYRLAAENTRRRTR